MDEIGRLFSDESAEAFFRGELEKLRKETASLRKTNVEIARRLGIGFCSSVFSQVLTMFALSYLAEGGKDSQIYDLMTDFLSERFPNSIRKLVASKKVKDIFEIIDEFNREMMDLNKSFARTKGVEQEVNRFIEKFGEL